MNGREAIGILKEMRAWLMKEGPYTDSNPDTMRGMPYTSEEFCEAIEQATLIMDMVAESYFVRDESKEHNKSH